MIYISIKKLRHICQNSDYGYKQYPLLFKFFRIISIYFTWILIQANITPNAITLLGILFGLMSAIAFIIDAPIFAVALVFLAIIADFSDGEVSRYKCLTSKEGSYLDKVHHAIVHPFFLGGFVIWVEGSLESNLVLPFGMLSVLNSFLLPFILMYAVDVVLLKHLLRSIKSNVIDTPTCYPNNIVDTSKSKMRGATKALVSFFQRVCDFPYVLVICSALIIGHEIDYRVISNKIFIYFLIAYSLITSMLITIYLMNTVFRKVIERRLTEIKNF